MMLRKVNASKKSNGFTYSSVVKLLIFGIVCTIVTVNYLHIHYSSNVLPQQDTSTYSHFGTDIQKKTVESNNNNNNKIREKSSSSSLSSSNMKSIPINIPKPIESVESSIVVEENVVKKDEKNNILPIKVISTPSPSTAKSLTTTNKDTIFHSNDIYRI